MRFQVGSLTCEMSLNDSRGVQTRWFLRGQKVEPPKYLDAADRRQYRAGRNAFLHAVGKLPARLGPQSSWHTPRRIAPTLVIAAALAACAPGNGIGLEAMLADHNCEQAGYEIGTREYAQCPMALYQQSAVNAAAMQGSLYARQAESARQNQPQTCTYNGSNIGGITGRTMHAGNRGDDEERNHH
jgi:hypothetical protein